MRKLQASFVQARALFCRPKNGGASNFRIPVLLGGDAVLCIAGKDIKTPEKEIKNRTRADESGIGRGGQNTVWAIRG